MLLETALRDTTIEYLTKLGLIPVFLGQSEEDFLLSAQQVNILTGMHGGLKGNIMFGFSKQLAFKIISAVSGDNDIIGFDSFARKALAEFSETICRSALEKSETSEPVDRSPTTVITGDRLFLHISKNTTTKLSFRIEEQFLYLSFSLDL